MKPSADGAVLPISEHRSAEINQVATPLLPRIRSDVFPPGRAAGESVVIAILHRLHLDASFCASDVVIAS
jgi:hypothetical protein